NGMDFGARAWNRAERRSAGTDDIGLVQGFLRRTLAAARPAYRTADLRDPTITFAGEPDTLDLVAPQPAADGPGAWTQEHFGLRRHGAAAALYVELRRDAPDGQQQAEVQAPAARVMLLDHVSQLRFAYFGAPAPGEAPVWLDRWTGQARLPALVRVTILRDDPALGVWPELVVRPRVTANAGCVYDPLSGRCPREALR
ncbi:hypothetical protein, partial [Acidisphaera rubrifaciens]|uniref:hypothetical protein n=1 Tax=Acidisphaera rubrifaciens TaxID=50715 RepID=UPI0006625288